MKIDQLIVNNNNLEKIVKEHVTDINNFEKSNSKLTMKIDDLDQYGRRNSLRVNGLAETKE